MSGSGGRAGHDDPTIQRAYRECAEHYGFLIDPNPPRTPRLKGKVEQGGVHFVCRSFLAGGTPEPIHVLNGVLRQWAETIAGQRVHGTTKQRPWERFTSVERRALQPVPAEPHDVAIWKQVRLHRDCHVVFEQRFYSAPYRLVGQSLWVRGGARIPGCVRLARVPRRASRPALPGRHATAGAWRTPLRLLLRYPPLEVEWPA
jgi:hypothetical protein